MSTRSLFTKNAARAGFAAAALAAGVAGFSVTSAVAQDAPEDTPQEEAPSGNDDDGENCNGRRGHHGEALAEIIGIEVDALREALQSGQTPAEVAEDNGVSRDELVSGLEEAMNERLDRGGRGRQRLTQEEADEKAADISDRANSIADGERPEGPRGPRGPRGPDGPADDADQDAEAEEGTA